MLGNFLPLAKVSNYSGPQTLDDSLPKAWRTPGKMLIIDSTCNACWYTVGVPSKKRPGQNESTHYVLTVCWSSPQTVGRSATVLTSWGRSTWAVCRCRVLSASAPWSTDLAAAGPSCPWSTACHSPPRSNSCHLGDSPFSGWVFWGKSSQFGARRKPAKLPWTSNDFKTYQLNFSVCWVLHLSAARSSLRGS